MELRDRIAQAIKGSGQDDRTIARAVGVSPQAVGQWRNGRTKNLRMENLYAFAQATGFAPRWIATGEGPERDSSQVPAILDLYAELLPEQQRELENFAAYLASKNASRPQKKANG